MDEMRINSNFLRGIIARGIARVINKKTGYEPTIDFMAPVTATIDDNIGEIHLDVKISLPKDQLGQFLAKLF